MAEKRQNNPLVKVTPVHDTSAYDEALRRTRKTEDSGFWEERAREAARKFGVDENLSPRERCHTIARAFNKRGGAGGGFRERVPGEDDE